MNKKGFTLVELLSVIAILAILVIIVLPNIVNMFNNAKRNTFITELKNIYTASEQTWLKDSMSASSNNVYAQSSESACTHKLQLDGRDNIYYYVEFNSSGKIIKFYVTDGTYQYQSDKVGLLRTDLDEVSDVNKINKYEKITITCDGAVVIDDERVTTFVTGQTINKTMKNLANNISNATVNTEDTNITAFKKWTGNQVPSGVDKENVSISGSDTDIYMWYDNGTIYYFSETKNIYLNANCQEMFSKLSNLVDTSGLQYLNTSNVTNMSSMFNSCKNLTSLDLSNFDTSKVTNMSSMFAGDSKITSINLSSFDTSKVTTFASMFHNCSALPTLDLSNFNTSSATKMSSMFYGCNKLQSLDLSNFNTSKVTTMATMFHNCKDLTSLDVSSFDTSNVTTMNGMFYYCEKVAYIDVSNFNTSKVTTMNNMFAGCKSVNNLDVSNFDTSNVTTIAGMFYSNNSLTSIDVTNFDTSKVTSLSGTFAGCSKLTQLDLSSFNTSNVTTMASLFRDCKLLYDFDVSHFNTSKVTSMYAMFNNCQAITSLDLHTWDVSNVTSFGTGESSYDGMFMASRNIVELDLRNWHLNENANTGHMFSGCTKLERIYVNDSWNGNSIPSEKSYQMFNNDTKLPNFDSTVIDSTRAFYGGNGYLLYKD